MTNGCDGIVRFEPGCEYLTDPPGAVWLVRERTRHTVRICRVGDRTVTVVRRFVRVRDGEEVIPRMFGGYTLRASHRVEQLRLGI